MSSLLRDTEGRSGQRGLELVETDFPTGGIKTRLDLIKNFYFEDRAHTTINTTAPVRLTAGPLVLHNRP